MKESGVILLSGGMDSGVLLASLLPTFSRLDAISFNYGSKHNLRELAAARAIAKRYAISHQIIELDFFNRLFQSSLLQSGGEIPEGTYNEVNMASTVVPFRNGIMLSIATGYAENFGLNSVLIGSHSGDHAVYPDCRPEFTKAMSEAASAGTANNVKIVAPFANFPKAKIAEIGREHDFDFALTWSCYKGGETHCGVCGTCNERKVALGFAEGKDPTKYLR